MVRRKTSVFYQVKMFRNVIQYLCFKQILYNILTRWWLISCLRPRISSGLGEPTKDREGWVRSRPIRLLRRKHFQPSPRTGFAHKAQGLGDGCLGIGDGCLSILKRNKLIHE